MTGHVPLHDFLKARPASLSQGPLAVILVEDDAAVAETLRHHLRLGFRHVLALSQGPVAIPDDLAPRVMTLDWPSHRPGAMGEAINAIIPAVPPGTWLFVAFNAEFLFFPFSETRSVGEMLAFHAEERRDAVPCPVIDLYAPDLDAAPDGVSLPDAMFDATGYFALDRVGPDGTAPDRDPDLFGGLRLRFEEHVPPARRRINRTPLFRAARGLQMDDQGRFDRPEMNTLSCPWHRNLTGAVASFRAAKALMANPASREAIGSFRWAGSRPFDWRSGQLSDLGLIDPGQWF